MDNFDLGAALRHYRKREGLTMREMADKLNMSKSAYERLENGITEPTYKMIMDIRKKLDLEEPIPTSLEGQTPPVQDSMPASAPEPALPPQSKWYQSKMWRLMAPFIIYFFFTIMIETRGFRVAWGGEEEIARHPPDRIFLVFSLIISAIYWWFKRPEIPFMKK